MLFLYARNMWEAQERYTNASFFFTPLFRHIQDPKTLETMKPESLINVLRSIGTLSYKDESVRRLVKAGAERLTGDLVGLQTLLSTAVNIKDHAELINERFVDNFLKLYTDSKLPSIARYT